MKHASCIILVFSGAITSLHSQKMTCDDMEEFVRLEERSWTDNQDLLDPELFTMDYRSYRGDVLAGEKFTGRAEDIQKTHDEIDNFALEILDYSCTDQRIVLFWKATGDHRQFKVPVKIFGMSMSKLRDWKAYETVTVHDMLPSLLAGGIKMSFPESGKE